jgi:hypothetical protein
MTDELYPPARRPFLKRRGLWLGALIVLVLVLAVYYPVGMALVHEVDDDPQFSFAESALPANGSRAVAVAAALIRRETQEHRWVANDPWFLPGAALDNMPNFQMGIIGALARFSFELTDQLGRTRGSSQTDPDLQEAAGQLQYQGTVWVIDFATSWAPTTPSEKRYLAAARSLERYNVRLSEGQAVFDRRSDNLLSTLDRIALDLGASSAALDQHIAENAGAFLDRKADDLFYGVIGQTNAYYLVLRELRRDFDKLIVERDLDVAWTQMLTSLEEAAALSPFVVVNGRPDSNLQPSHLAAQGFYVLRARTQLREITNILLK